MNKLLLVLACFLFVFTAQAQDAAQEKPAANTEAVSSAQSSEKPSAPAGKQMIREANISLQTTVTGNQEQPRVMYILPWQSPLSPDLEMEMLSSQEDAIFGHIERDEMQRSLEAAGELDQPDE
ncbi:hypothetical protein [Cellvibrio sp. UBA7661]|uniref:hypothetical protein n=1 Tax=Cellvibrio sp. UBA7661 TaxID=1946311 RepID=UPI002F353451